MKSIPAPAYREVIPAAPDIPPAYLLWRRLPGGLGLALWLLITLRIGLELIALVSLHLQPITVIGGDWLNLLIHGPRPWSDLLSVWQRWDALWFQQIAKHGYHAGDGTVAFQPLFPLLSRIVSLPLFGHIVLAELIVSSAAFFMSMWLLYWIARLDMGPIAARLAVLLVAFFPVGFFLLAPYTEGLYLTLSLAAFWFARRGHPWFAGFAGLGAGLTRTVAMFLVLPLAFEYIRQRDEQGRLPGIGLVAATLPVVGMIAVTLYQRVVVGESSSIFQIQARWGSHVAPPWDVLPASWEHIVHTGDPIEVLNLAALLLFALLGLALLRQLPLSYALYALPYLALFFSHESYLSPLLSVTRFMLVLFPCFLVLAIWLARRPWLATGWLVISLMLQSLLLADFVHFGFVA